MKKTDEIRALISKSKTPEALTQLQKLVRDNPIIDEIIIQKARFTELERAIIRDTERPIDLDNRRNKINDSILRIIRIIEDNTSPKPNLTAYFLAIFGLICALGVAGYYLHQYQERITAPDVALIGSGTVFNYLGRQLKDELSYPRIIPLASPSETGISLLTNVFQDDDGSERRKNMPYIIGMASFDLESPEGIRLFNLDKKFFARRKYFMLQVGDDKLTVSIKGNSLEEIKALSGQNINLSSTERDLEVEKISMIIDQADKGKILATEPQSGTFKSWNELFCAHNLNPIPIDKTFVYTNSPESRDSATNTPKPWIALGGENYNLGLSESETHITFTVRDTINGLKEPASRPLFLVGILPDEEVSAKGKSYIIEDEVLYIFWKKVLSAIEGKGRIWKEYIKHVREKRIIDLGDNRLKIVHKDGYKNIEVIRRDEMFDASAKGSPLNAPIIDVCKDNNQLAYGKCPDENRQTPEGGAY